MAGGSPGALHVSRLQLSDEHLVSRSCAYRVTDLRTIVKRAFVAYGSDGQSSGHGGRRACMAQSG
jgi:hypothetical protein